MIIYNQQGAVLLDIPVDDNSYRYRAIRQGDKVYLYFSLAEHVEIPVYSYVEYQGQRYTLWRPEDLTKHGTRNLEYALTLGGDWELLNRTKYKHLSAIPRKLKFQLTGKPRFFLQLLVDNLNERDGGWTIGSCVDATEKTLAFSHEYCLEALNRFADEWETEFELLGKTINFGKVEYYKSDPLPLAYGKGNGLKTGVTRQSQGDKAPVSILYVQGGDKNIDPTQYGSETLLLPKSQELEYEGRRYKTDKDGMCITRADRELPNRDEDSFDASHIYPSRVGTVSEVIMVDAEKNLYDFRDSSIPDNLDYSACRIPGERATVIFQSGVMVGEEFDLEQTDDELTGYIHAERRFKLVPVEKSGGVIPNENRKPSVGDTYAVFNISLPSAYVCDNATKSGASWDMFREAARYLYENEEETFTFKGELDGIWSKSRWLEVGGRMLPGSYILFSDPQFQPGGIAIRITGVKDYINCPNRPEIELSNTPVAGFVSSELGKLEGNEVKDEQRHSQALNYTKRRWRDALEAQGMLEAAFDNYTKGIDPIWVRTMSLLVGDESLQFRFVNSRTNPIALDLDFIYNEDTQIFSAPKSILQHMTLGISDIKGEHDASEYKYWDIPAYTSPALGDFGKMYLYVRCAKNGTGGTFLLSEEPYGMEESDYYYFLVGLLGSQFDGTRSFVTVYGFTEILPGRITADRIVSTDGQCYFNLGIGEIGGKIRMIAGSSGLKQMEEWGDVEETIYSFESEFTNMGNKISAQVTAFNEFKEEVESAGWVTESNGNKLWASKTLEDGDEIISYINQTATTLTISASRINLNGAVTINSLGESLKQTINGKVNSSDIGAMAYKDEVSYSYLDDWLRDYVDGKASATDLTKYVLTTDLNSKLTGYEKVGSAEDVQDYLINILLHGTTTILGGYISTSLINADWVVANAASIGGFTIQNDRLTSDRMSLIPTTGLLFSNTGLNTDARIGSNVLPATSATACCLYAKNTRYSGGLYTNGMCAYLTVGRSAYADVPQVWITCEHADGWGAGFSVEARYFGDSSNMNRTCIKASHIPTKAQLEKFVSGVSEYTLKYDANSGYLFI